MSRDMRAAVQGTFDFRMARHTHFRSTRRDKSGEQRLGRFSVSCVFLLGFRSLLCVMDDDSTMGSRRGTWEAHLGMGVGHSRGA